MALKNYMIKPNLKVVNFNIDYKLPSKEVEYNKTQVMMYGRTADIDKRFPNGKEKVVEAKTGSPDPSADIPVFGGPLIPISLSAAVGKATKNMKAVAGVALSSVNSMASGLESLKDGSVAEMIALAKLDAAILEAQAELGEISVGNKDKLSMGLETDAIKAAGIKTPGNLGDALSMGDPSGSIGKFAGIDGAMAATKGLSLPSVSKAVSSTGDLSFEGVNKLQGFRDIVENVDVKIKSLSDLGSFSDIANSITETTESFTKMARTTRVFGTETDLNNAFGVDDFANVSARRSVIEAPRPSNKLSIARKEWNGVTNKWTDTGAA